VWNAGSSRHWWLLGTCLALLAALIGAAVRLPQFG
jgi:hypothetical protein